MEQQTPTMSEPLLSDCLSEAEAARSEPSPQKNPMETVRAHHALLHASTPFSDCEFSETEWVSHHSWTRYLPEPIKLIRLVAALFPPLLWILLVSVACGIYQEFRPAYWYDLQHSNLAFAYGLTSFALSLLLVFKTNASYGRWQEAQAAWSSVFAAVTNIVCKVQAFAPPEATEGQKLLFVRWAIALPYVLRAHLLSYVPGTLSLDALLSKEEYEWLQKQPVMPLAAAQMIGSIVGDLKMAQTLESAVHADLSAYVVALGVLQRLARAPIPMSYTRHTVRYLVAYLSVLPVALWPSLEWLTTFFAPATAFLLCGIENISNQIENPLLVLPMARYCASLHVTIIGLTRAWSHGKPQTAHNLMREQLQRQTVPTWQTRPLSFGMMALAAGALSRARTRLAAKRTSLAISEGASSVADRESVESDQFDINATMSLVQRCMGDFAPVEDDETAMSYIYARGRRRVKALRKCFSVSGGGGTPRGRSTDEQSAAYETPRRKGAGLRRLHEAVVDAV